MATGVCYTQSGDIKRYEGPKILDIQYVKNPNNEKIGEQYSVTEQYTYNEGSNNEYVQYYIDTNDEHFPGFEFSSKGPADDNMPLIFVAYYPQEPDNPCYFNFKIKYHHIKLRVFSSLPKYHFIKLNKFKINCFCPSNWSLNKTLLLDSINGIIEFDIMDSNYFTVENFIDIDSGIINLIDNRYGWNTQNYINFITSKNDYINSVGSKDSIFGCPYTDIFNILDDEKLNYINKWFLLYDSKNIINKIITKDESSILWYCLKYLYVYPINNAVVKKIDNNNIEYTVDYGKTETNNFYRIGMGTSGGIDDCDNSWCVKNGFGIVSNMVYQNTERWKAVKLNVGFQYFKLNLENFDYTTSGYDFSLLTHIDLDTIGNKPDLESFTTDYGPYDNNSIYLNSTVNVVNNDEKKTTIPMGSPTDYPRVYGWPKSLCSYAYNGVVYGSYKNSYFGTITWYNDAPSSSKRGPGFFIPPAKWNGNNKNALFKQYGINGNNDLDKIIIGFRTDGNHNKHNYSTHVLMTNISIGGKIFAKKCFDGVIASIPQGKLYCANPKNSYGNDFIGIMDKRHKSSGSSASTFTYYNNFMFNLYSDKQILINNANSTYIPGNIQDDYCHTTGNCDCWIYTNDDLIWKM